MDEAAKIVAGIKSGNIKPIYFLMGEEPYYIDKIAEYIEEHVLSDDEKAFNQTIVYGRDVSIEDIVGTSKRFPMMSERQVVIVKEAQELYRTIDKLESYAQDPMSSTVLVMCYKYKTLDKRRKLVKLIGDKGLVFESKKLFENQVGQWISRLLQGRGYAIEPKANAMLVEFLGNDLGKISNELDKLQIILPKGSSITAKHIEDNIGFSKDFNVFELLKAIGDRNQQRAYQIVKHFSANPKEHPMVLTTTQVFSFFTKLLLYHGLKDKSAKNVAAVLKINPYFVKDYELGARNYPMKAVSGIVSALRNTDLASKGVKSNAADSDLQNQLLYHIFN